MAFLHNAWYVAAWDDEVAPSAILHRRLLDESICLFRDGDGEARALLDRCPHRHAPLHLGAVQGGHLQCRYHGLAFNGSGECVHNPQGPPPRAARVRAFPVIERHSLIWVWMGEARDADPALIPDFHFQDPETAFVGKGYLHVRTSYLLEIDNILDLSHIEFLHATTLGSGGVSKGTYRASKEGDTIWSKRTTHADIIPDALSDAMGIPRQTPVDRWINVRWNAPAHMALFAGAVSSGRPQTDGRETSQAHCFTPESASSTHYWFSICFPRSFGEAGERLAREQLAFLRAPFVQEDLPMLEGQQRNIGDGGLSALQPVLLPGDAAAVHARRVLETMLAHEAQAQRSR